MAMKAEIINQEKITALYCRLSVEDIKDDSDKRRKGKEDESNSISNQKQIRSDYAKKHGYTNMVIGFDKQNHRKSGVILSDRRESKDLRTDFTANVTVSAKILRLRCAPLRMTYLLHCALYLLAYERRQP